MEKETKENLGMIGFFGIFALVIILGSIFQNPSVLLIGFGWIGANIILYAIITIIIIAAPLFLGYYLNQREREGERYIYTYIFTIYTIYIMLYLLSIYMYIFLNSY